MAPVVEVASQMATIDAKEFQGRIHFIFYIIFFLFFLLLFHLFILSFYHFIIIHTLPDTFFPQIASRSPVFAFSGNYFFGPCASNVVRGDRDFSEDERIWEGCREERERRKLKISQPVAIVTESVLHTQTVQVIMDYKKNRTQQLLLSLTYIVRFFVFF